MATSDEQHDDKLTPQRTAAKEAATTRVSECEREDDGAAKVSLEASPEGLSSPGSSEGNEQAGGTGFGFLLTQAPPEEEDDDNLPREKEYLGSSEGNEQPEGAGIGNFLTQAPLEEADDDLPKKEEGLGIGSSNPDLHSNNLQQKVEPVGAGKNDLNPVPPAAREERAVMNQADSQPADHYESSHKVLQKHLPKFRLAEELGDLSDDESSNSGYSGTQFDDDEDDNDDDEDNDSSNEKPNLLERRKRKVQRNDERMIALGLLKPDPEKEIDEGCLSPFSPQPLTPKNTQHAPIRGMVFATPYNSSQYETVKMDAGVEDEAILLEKLQEAYPHRESQIQQLWSLLSTALPCTASAHSSKSNVPAPILITGTTGTGKTTIVRDLTTCLKQTCKLQSQAARVGSAYINCATLNNTIDELVHEAYRQLAHDMKAGRQYMSPRKKRKRKRKALKKQGMPFLPGADPKRRCLPKESEGTVPKNSQTVMTTEAQDAAAATVGATDIQNQIAAEGKAQKQTTDNPAPVQAAKEFEPRRSLRLTDPSDGPAVNDKKGKVTKELSADLKATTTTTSPTGEISSSAATASRSAYVAAAAFGQELKESLFKHPHDAAFLILDNAERLLSLSTTSSSKTNFLAQLLLLPRDKGLNLTIIVISKSIVLEHTLFNNLKSMATLLSAIQPMKVHFQAYKGKERFRQILAQKQLLERIIGPEMLRSYASGNDPFIERVVQSFLNVLVQSLYGSSRDLKEIVRLGRSLWPLYVAPLHSARIEKTMASVQKMFRSSSKGTSSAPPTTQSAGKHVIAFLDQQILPQMRRKLDQCMYSLRDDDGPKQMPSGESSTSNDNGNSKNGQKVGSLETLPYLTKCLLLAAFICQTNRANKDKQLFTIQKNGKKNNGNKRKSPGEDVAFCGAGKYGISKTYRRMFPMERMLSVFVSIVGLNQDQCNSQAPTEIDPGKVGSSDFFESLAFLRQMGVLQDRANGRASSAEAANLAAPRFWCSLTRDEADAVSRSVNFRLENYLF